MKRSEDGKDSKRNKNGKEMREECHNLSLLKGFRQQQTARRLMKRKKTTIDFNYHFGCRDKKEPILESMCEFFQVTHDNLNEKKPIITYKD